MNDFFRFPSTPHLAWLAEGALRGDKLLTPALASNLLSSELVVEEKVDGANLGFSTTEDGQLLVQNRGSYLRPESCHPQFKPIWPWLGSRTDRMIDALWPDLILFGEWCLAQHTVPYDALPDWYLGFDVYDRKEATFWDSSRRNQLLAGIGLEPVPQLTTGVFDLPSLVQLLGVSRVGATPMEGIIVRREADGLTQERAKLVQAEFTQSIGCHWSQTALVRNRLEGESS